jgi:serine/threonine protein kinase
LLAASGRAAAACPGAVTTAAEESMTSERRSTLDESSVRTSVGRYKLLTAIGHGGMADVYLALARGPAGFNKLLVVKKLREAFVRDVEFLTMFMDEARLAARLSHPNVVQTYEVGHDGGTYFIAMEYLDGQPLHRVLQRFNDRGGFPLVASVRVLADMLAGLDHAHELCDFDGTPLEVVHRDVTPQNVFVTYDGQIKLVDFGIAKAMDSVAETQVGMFKGKLAYMSPEQARGERLDRRSDVFSAGMMLWEAIAGRRMWKGFAEVEIARRLAGGDVPHLAEVAPDADPALIEICERALAASPDHRFPTAIALAHALEDWLDTRPQRSDSRLVGKLVGSAFVEERERMRAIIDEQMRLVTTSGSAQSQVLPELAAHVDALHQVREQSRVGAMTPVDAATPDEVTRPYDIPRRRARPVLVASAAAIVIGGFGVGGYLTRALWMPGATSGAGVAADASPATTLAAAPSEATLAPAEGSAGSATGSKAPATGASAAWAGDPCLNPSKPLVELSGDLDESATLSCDKDYLLKFNVFVRAGATLTIEPGTTIKGDRDTRGTLIVQPGAKLVAEGSAERPIVFTSEFPVSERHPGDWGGVMLLGNAPINLRDAGGRPKRGAVEGLVEGGEYGGNDPEDSSGSLKFVRIEYSGIELAPNNEINGLTLAGVGRGTKIEQVMIRNVADDCFEFFGGNVDGRHLICQHPGDDGFDFDYGYTGRLQFIVVRDDPSKADSSNGLELDNDPNGTAHTPITEPTIWNATLCGTRHRGTTENYGVLVRRRARVHLGNAVVMGFDAGVDLRDGGTLLDVHHAAFFDHLTHAFAYPERKNGAVPQEQDDDLGVDENALLKERGRAISLEDPGIEDCFHPRSPKLSPRHELAEGASAPPNDGFFDPSAVFLGAVRDGADPWISAGWIVWDERAGTVEKSP